MRGFRVNEKMTGYHIFEPGFDPDSENIKDIPYLMELNITWGPDNFWKWINPFNDEFMKQQLYGTITIDGIDIEIQCKGILEINLREGFIRYNILFEHDDVRYNYICEKNNIRPWNLHKTLTTCYGILHFRSFFGDILVSKSKLNFNIKNLPKFIKSFKII